jgi:hypothetical protein
MTLMATLVVGRKRISLTVQKRRSGKRLPIVGATLGAILCLTAKQRVRILALATMAVSVHVREF